jgi:hypothetical protein
MPRSGRLVVDRVAAGWSGARAHQPGNHLGQALGRPPGLHEQATAGSSALDQPADMAAPTQDHLTITHASSFEACGASPRGRRKPACQDHNGPPTSCVPTVPSAQRTQDHQACVVVEWCDLPRAPPIGPEASPSRSTSMTALKRCSATVSSRSTLPTSSPRRWSAKHKSSGGGVDHQPEHRNPSAGAKTSSINRASTLTFEQDPPAICQQPSLTSPQTAPCSFDSACRRPLASRGPDPRTA